MTSASAADVFRGFAPGARATAVPSAFFSQLLPQIEDADELRVTLYAIYALARRRGYPNFVTGHELQAEAPLIAALGGDGEAEVRLTLGLAAAVERGSLLAIAREGNSGQPEMLYLLNTASGRRAAVLLRSGALAPSRPLAAPSSPPAAVRANVFRLYEENIGPLTPLVAQELEEAEALYPQEWIEEAFREAAALNKRSWRYAARILERWATEGRQREETGRDPGEGDSARAQVIRRFEQLSGGR